MRCARRCSPDTALDRVTGGRILLKLETLQHTGSFKFRGAWNRLVQLDDAQRAAGVVAFSSGNHAQGVAAAARRLGIRATIVMPADAPRMKLQNTRDLGAEIVEYDRVHESREQIAARLAAERGATLVPSFDDPDVIAGQGTAGLEIAEQAAELGLTLDDVVVCCSGGGLTAGIALALGELAPQAGVWTAEPAGYDDHRRSLAARAAPAQPARRRAVDLRRAARPDPGRTDVRDQPAAAARRTRRLGRRSAPCDGVRRTHAQAGRRAGRRGGAGLRPRGPPRDARPHRRADGLGRQRRRRAARGHPARRLSSA